MHVIEIYYYWTESSHPLFWTQNLWTIRHDTSPRSSLSLLKKTGNGIHSYSSLWFWRGWVLPLFKPSAFALQRGVFCHLHKFPTKAEFSMCATFLSPKRHSNIWYSQTSCLIHYSLFKILSEIQAWSERIKKKSQIKKLSNHTFIDNINKSESPYAGIQESKLHDEKLTHNRNSTKPRIKGAHFQWVIATTSTAWGFFSEHGVLLNVTVNIPSWCFL